MNFDTNPASPVVDTERYYWDTETWAEGEQPYGDDTARIIDNEAGGVIAYVHCDNAAAFVANLTANPIPAE